MSRLKTPHDFDDHDWQVYLLKALRRETGAPWTFKGHELATWVRLIKGQRKDGMDPYMLALGIDLIALDWEIARYQSPWELLSSGRLTWIFFQTIRPDYFWRALWYSRFARAGPEVTYYSFWFEQLEVALDAEPGLYGQREWTAKAREKLEFAEKKIKERNPSEPTFAVHYLRELYATSRA